MERDVDGLTILGQLGEAPKLTFAESLTVARRVLGEATAWDAGIRLMRADNPEAWQAIVNAADMARENHIPR